MAAIFITMFLLYFVRAVPYSRVLRAAAERSSLLGGDKRIHLRIDEERLHGTVEGQTEIQGTTIELGSNSREIRHTILGGDFPDPK